MEATLNNTVTTGRVGVLREVHARGERFRIVTPDRVIELEWPVGSHRPRLTLWGARSGEIMGARRPVRDRIRATLWRWFAPRIVRLCPTCGGGEARSEVRVTLPQMVEHRAAACGPCERRNGRWCTACGCFLPLKQRIAGAACPEGKW